MVVGLTPKQWRGLCEATGLTEELQRLATAKGLDFSREGDRYVARREIAALIESWATQRSIEDIEIAFARERVCWSRYRSVTDMVQSDPNCSPNNPMFVRQEQPAVGKFLMAGSPLEFGRLDREDTDIAPRLGEHTEEVLSQVLHLSSGEIGRLSERDVVLVR